MKRPGIIFLTLLVFSTFLIPVSVQASSLNKGEMTLGVKGGYASFNHSGTAGVFFQYTFAPHVRLSPEISCVFRNRDRSALAVSADMHFPFRMARGFNIYPLAGLTFNAWNYSNRSNMLRFGADVGAGLELYLTGNLKLNLQGKYSFMKDTSGAFASLGVGYVF